MKENLFLYALKIYLKLSNEFGKQLSKITDNKSDDEIEDIIFSISIFKRFDCVLNDSDKEKIISIIKAISNRTGMYINAKYDKLYLYIHFERFDKYKMSKKLVRN